MKEKTNVAIEILRIVYLQFHHSLDVAKGATGSGELAGQSKICPHSFFIFFSPAKQADGA